MCAQKQIKKRSLISSVFTNRCPRCRQGKLFSNSNPYNFGHNMDMPEHCPVCGQPFELQTGFYFGTGYVSYTLSVAFLAISFAATYLAGLISISDNSIFYWLGASTLALLILQPVIQRLSRSMWIAFFVRYNPEGGPARL